MMTAITVDICISQTTLHQTRKTKKCSRHILKPFFRFLPHRIRIDISYCGQVNAGRQVQKSAFRKFLNYLLIQELHSMIETFRSSINNLRKKLWQLV